MNSTFPIYDVVLDDESLGLTAISLVDEPAIQTDFLAFKEQQMIWFSKADKHEIVSPVLIPNQLILRQSEDGHFYYIRWTREAIADAAHRYLMNGWFNNFTVMHPTFYNKDMKYEDALEKGVYMLRMWTIEDERKDDANTKYGFNLPAGTLMVHMKVHNRKIWQRIKSGELRGLSIEAFSNIVRTDNKTKQNINQMDINNKQYNLFHKFVQFLNEVSVEAKELSDIAKNDNAESGEISLKYFIDDEHYIEVDAEGFARDEQGNVVSEGEYMLADGNYITVDANGKFVDTHTEAETEEEPVEAPIAEKKVDEDEKNDEEPKGEDEKPEGEDGGSADDNGAEEPANGDEASAETEPTEVEEPVEEVPAEEPVEEIPVDVEPFEIDGVEYELPVAVIEYIKAILAERDGAEEEVQMMKEVTPSVKPIPTVIAQSDVKDEPEDGLFNAIRLLNRRK